MLFYPYIIDLAALSNRGRQLLSPAYHIYRVVHPVQVDTSAVCKFGIDP